MPAHEVLELQEFFEKYNISNSAMKKASGMSYQHLSKILAGKQVGKVLITINLVTGAFKIHHPDIASGKLNINLLNKEEPHMDNATISDFCEHMKITPAILAKACGVESQYIYNLKNRSKQLHIVRHDAETGDVQLIRTEKIMCKGNLRRERHG